MRLSPLAAALRTRRRNAGLQALRKDLAALLAISLEAGKGQLPKALHVVIPQKKAWRKTAGRPRMHNATPKIRLYSEVP